MQSTLLQSSSQLCSVYRLVGFGDTAAMKPESAALRVISVNAPSIDVAAVAEAVLNQFGLSGDYAPLVSERDQNFHLQIANGKQYVVKVVGSGEDAVSTNFQTGALRHLQRASDVRTPGVVKTLNGDLSGDIVDGKTRYQLRVVTWVPGVQLETLGIDERLADGFGAALARLHRAFDGYSHPGENRLLLWDLQRVLELTELLDFIKDDDIRSAVEDALLDYERNVLPVIPALRKQVIHNDANPENVLVDDGEFGFIDFGDMIRAPRIFDVAIAAAYLRRFDDNPTAIMESFVAGFHAELPIEAIEADQLFDLVRARLATSISLLYWRLDARDENDPYRQKALELESGAFRFLKLLDGVGRIEFREKFSYIQ